MVIANGTMYKCPVCKQEHAVISDPALDTLRALGVKEDDLQVLIDRRNAQLGIAHQEEQNVAKRSMAALRAKAYRDRKRAGQQGDDEEDD